MARHLPLLLVLALGCADLGTTLEADDLPVGEVVAGDSKVDGPDPLYGFALTCKQAPVLTPLAQPRIIVSINGLTLHLIDDATGMSKVYPIGPGAIDQDPASATYGESLTWRAVAAAGTQDFTLQPDYVDPCKIWHTDKATGEKLPLFAGLPFLNWYGNYGFHGPIDNYAAENGGDLRRGFVSAGCVRMQSADILELYALTLGVRVRVHVQLEPERDAAGVRIDVPDRWIGSECTGDADCTFPGGFCQPNQCSGRGFCSARCTGGCPDKPGYPVTFCTADPESSNQGLCVMRESPLNAACRPYDRMVIQRVSRFGQPGVRTNACMPETPGWFGWGGCSQ
jgi:hypothetical protein